jgi:hypothetical protein
MGNELPIIDIHLLASSKPSSDGINILGHFSILPLLHNLVVQDIFIFGHVHILCLQGSLVRHFLAFPLVLFSFLYKVLMLKLRR